MFTFHKKQVQPSMSGNPQPSEIKAVEPLDDQIAFFERIAFESQEAIIGETALRIELEIALKRLDPAHPLVRPDRRQTPEWKYATGERYEFVKQVVKKEKSNASLHHFIHTIQVREGEIDRLVRQAKSATLGAMLPVYDTLRLAQENGVGLPPHHAEGLAAAVRQFEEALIAAGAEPVGQKGERFDPLLHEAVREVPAEQGAKGLIQEVCRAGFRIGQRLLRPAVVVVGK